MYNFGVIDFSFLFFMIYYSVLYKAVAKNKRENLKINNTKALGE